MAYIVVEDFKRGMDRRKLRVSGVPGSLWLGVNAHITRGGEIERRKKFVSKYTLPANTFHLEAAGGALYVFGSATAPTMPSGVSYQRLQHPDGSPRVMTAILDTEVFDGKVYAIAEFDDGSVHHFYDGTVVADLIEGVVRTAMADNAGIATHMAALVDADDDVSAAAVGAVITVTGPASGAAFEISASALNVEGGTDDQTATVATTTPAIPEVVAVAATSSFSITAGSANTAATGTVTLDSGASGSVDTITVNGVDVLGGAVPYNTSLSQTATDVAAAITSNVSSPEYTAAAVGTTITISATVAAGADPNGFAVVSGATTITTTDVNMSGGVTNAITSVTVDGVEILDNRVNWTVSHSGTATNLAAEITSATSSPEYEGSAEAALVTIEAAVAGTAANGKAVVVTTVGNVTVSDPIEDMSGGVAAAAGQQQVSTVTIGGTFEPGDRFTITIDDRDYGADGKPITKGRTALTFKGKMHVTAESRLEFSAVDAPTVWDRDDTTDPGAGFINFANQAAGSETLTGLGKYQGNLAVFSRDTVHIEYVEADDDNNVLLQTLESTGTRARGSIVSYGNNDLFYLDDTGIRSIRARDSSNTASVEDVGTVVDTFVREYLQTLTEAQIAAAAGVIEPVDGRYWLAVGTRIFAFSFFPGSKISAWTYHDITDDVGAAIDAWARIDDRLYARSGNSIFLYGGDDNDTYPDDDEIETEVHLPYLDAGTPATFKTFTGFDAAVEGEWTVALLPDPARESVVLDVGVVNATTYGKPRQVTAFVSTHVAAKLVARRAGNAKLSSFAMHYLDPHEAG